MEVISIERSTYEVIGLPLRSSKNCWRASTVSSQRWRRWLNEVTIWKPNSFTNLPQFAFSPQLYFIVLHRLAYISGRIGLIFQNRFAFTSFFRNFAVKLITTKKWRRWKKENWKRKIYLGGIHCVLTVSVLKRTSACTIRPGCWCPKIDTVARPSILQPGRTASADVSVRRKWWSRHGALRNSMTTCLIGKGLRLASVCMHYSVAGMGRTIECITVRICFRPKNRKRFWRFLPSLEALRGLVLIIMWRIGTLNESRVYCLPLLKCVYMVVYESFS